jgi:hypothetical protein
VSLDEVPDDLENAISPKLHSHGAVVEDMGESLTRGSA